MRTEKGSTTNALVALLMMICAALLLSPSATRAQEQQQKARQSDGASGETPKEATSTEGATAATASTSATTKPAVAPVFDDYKGVKIGTSAEEVRRLLGGPKEKSKAQDLYAFSGSETAQFFYDADGRVTAVAITYYGGKGDAPDASQVLGRAVEARPDGSLYHREPYPAAGYWVSYSRTAGDAPLVTITIQKMN